jgi:hypothetical protein
MENSPFGFLFGNTSTTAAHVKEPPAPPPAKIDPFKIPMKIVGRIMDNGYSGDGTIHPVITYYLYMNYACCSGV